MIKDANDFLKVCDPGQCRIVVIVDTHCAIDTGLMVHRLDDSRGALACPIDRVRLISVRTAPHALKW